MSESYRSNSPETNEFVKVITQLINTAPKTQNEIALALDYNNGPNMITMFKTGRTRVPMEKVVPLAHALHADPSKLFRLWCKTYMPVLLPTLEQIGGGIVLTGKEKSWIRGLRKDYGDDLPFYSSENARQMEKVY